MLLPLYLSLLATLCTAQLADPLAIVGLKKRQQCAPNWGYYPSCRGCCYNVTPAGCYAPVLTRGSTTITGAWACYPTPPGRIIGIESDTFTSTAAPPPPPPPPPPTTSEAAPSPTTPAVPPATSNAAPPTDGGDSCPNGAKLCNSGCIPVGDDCCPGRGFCTDDSFCKLSTIEGRYGCCPRGASCDTANCAADEQVCGESCISSRADCCNQNGNYCFPGSQCFQDPARGDRCCTPGVNCPGDSVGSDPRTTATVGQSEPTTVNRVSLSTFTQVSYTTWVPVSTPTDASGFQSGTDAVLGVSWWDTIVAVVAAVIL